MADLLSPSDALGEVPFSHYGAELIGEVVQYEDKFLLCYVRGQAGIIVALAEELF